jgi:hypothetical protein
MGQSRRFLVKSVPVWPAAVPFFAGACLEDALRALLSLLRGSQGFSSRVLFCRRRRSVFQRGETALSIRVGISVPQEMNKTSKSGLQTLGSRDGFCFSDLVFGRTLVAQLVNADNAVVNLGC